MSELRKGCIGGFFFTTACNIINAQTGTHFTNGDPATATICLAVIGFMATLVLFGSKSHDR